MGNKEARERKNRRRICYVWKMWESSTQMLQKKAIEKLNGTCRGSLLGTCFKDITKWKSGCGSEK